MAKMRERFLSYLEGRGGFKKNFREEVVFEASPKR